MKNILKERSEELSNFVSHTMSAARAELECLDFYGPYGHNMVSLILKSVAEKIGYDFANELVEEFDLNELGIHKKD